jgi:F-type H+-transporting ATPase subunit b
MISFGNKSRFAGMLALGCAASTSAFAEEGGLPQLDATLFPEQIFWLAVSFAVLYGLMSWVALPRVDKTQATRTRVIADEIQAARIANEQAKDTMLASEKSLAAARAKAQASVTEMLAAVAQETAQKQLLQERELQRELHRAEQEVAVEHEVAMKAVHKAVPELAATIIENIMKKGRAA